mmetsp:Transcript_77305/g.230302  ORF Transcript_77305/g.230302 Transcript_77305/m.230302 type:complete len:204 (-) Transcript_77305:2497-3108(-)
MACTSNSHHSQKMGDRSPSHPEHAVLPIHDRRVQRDRDAPCKVLAGVTRVDDAVVEDGRGRMVRRGVGLESLHNGRLHGVNLLLGQGRQTLTLPLTVLHVRDHACGLLSTHDGDLGVRPEPREARVVGGAVHSVVPCTVRARENHAKLGHWHAADGCDHLGTVLRDAAPLVLCADDETRDVVEEDQWDAPLAADLDEVRGLDG